MNRGFFISLLFPCLLFSIFLAACTGSAVSEQVYQLTPTTFSIFTDPKDSPQVELLLDTKPVDDDVAFEGRDASILVQVDANRDVHPISPFIYGLSGASPEVLSEMRPTLNSWGGNPSTRFNWKIGHAWNAGRDWFYRNGNYGFESGSVSEGFLQDAADAGVFVRFAVPTLGWVAKDDHLNTCSFPLEDGSCSDGGGSSCTNPVQVADPNLANVPFNVEDVAKWVRELTVEGGFDLRFIAMDNEPELWGFTHYDVHPTCTTYQEILDKYLEYASAIRMVAPDMELTGPVTCCWYYYWNSAAGEADKLSHGNQDFLPWFLDQVRLHDEKTGERTIDVLDIHYYPEGIYNQEVDMVTSAHRLRATRSLWDFTYIDESWIDEPVALIPRMQKLVDDYYPGTKLGISEWNFGADEDINGALAIADVLGIFGREDVYFANYWTHPPLGSPGSFAFQMYTNYDGEGRSIGDLSVWANSSNESRVTAYASLDNKFKKLYVVQINKSPELPADIKLDLKNYIPEPDVQLCRYDERNLSEITCETRRFDDFSMTLQPYSISLLVFSPKMEE